MFLSFLYFFRHMIFKLLPSAKLRELYFFFIIFLCFACFLFTLTLPFFLFIFQLPLKRSIVKDFIVATYIGNTEARKCDLIYKH